MRYATPEEARRAYRDDPVEFFDGVHREVDGDEAALISPQWRPAMARYHYNLVENAILDVLRERPGMPPIRHVLDVGSGTGHWVAFAAEILEAESVVATDFSEVAISRLAGCFANDARVRACVHDVGRSLPEREGGFDLVTAIGIFFHLVDDQVWERAVGRVIGALADQGLAVIGGEFEDREAELGALRKVRPLAKWREVVTAHGGEIAGLRKFEWFGNADSRGLKNNLLFVRRASTPADDPAVPPTETAS